MIGALFVLFLLLGAFVLMITWCFKVTAGRDAGPDLLIAALGAVLLAVGVVPFI